MERSLSDWLNQACMLLEVEARDQFENRQYDSPNQRKNIAKTLRNFIAAAEAAMERAEKTTA